MVYSSGSHRIRIWIASLSLLHGLFNYLLFEARSYSSSTSSIALYNTKRRIIPPTRTPNDEPISVCTKGSVKRHHSCFVSRSFVGHSSSNSFGRWSTVLPGLDCSCIPLLLAFAELLYFLSDCFVDTAFELGSIAKIE